MLLFAIFLLFFAECNQLLGVDRVPYGRTPPILSHFLAMLRCSLGDFAPIDMYQTYDIIIDEDAEDDSKYKHSLVILMVTWLIFLMTALMLTMVFMNFIIAVISDAYGGVI